jgi:hypothetical protein
LAIAKLVVATPDRRAQGLLGDGLGQDHVGVGIGRVVGDDRGQTRLVRGVDLAAAGEEGLERLLEALDDDHR